MIWTFSNVSWKMLFKLFQVQNNFTQIKTMHTLYNRPKFTMHTTQKITAWYGIRKDGEVDINLTFQERAALNVPGLF